MHDKDDAMWQDILQHFEKVILHPVRPTSYNAHIFRMKKAFNIIKNELKGEPKRVPWFLDLLYKIAISV